MGDHYHVSLSFCTATEQSIRTRILFLALHFERSDPMADTVHMRIGQITKCDRTPRKCGCDGESLTYQCCHLRPFCHPTRRPYPHLPHFPLLFFHPQFLSIRHHTLCLPLGSRRQSIQAILRRNVIFLGYLWGEGVMSTEHVK